MERHLSKRYFGEGLALLGERLYQLTWKSGQGFVYDKRTLRPVRQFRYEGEGWGLASDGRWLYMSNGSSQISVRNAADFSEVRAIEVHGEHVPTSGLNELEIIDGMIWANVYRTDTIVVIDPATGLVVAHLDLTRLARAQPTRADVLNGIAHDTETGHIFVTGKLWPTLYEIRLLPY